MELFRKLFGPNKSKANFDSMQDIPAPVTATNGPEAEAHSAPASGAMPPTALQTRPLDTPKAYITVSPARRIKHGLASDVGRVRNNNQDSSLTLMASAEVTGNPPAIGLFVVADGMGGHKDGELVSALTVQTLAHHVMDHIIIPQLASKELTSDQKTIPEVLSDAMAAANEAAQRNVPNGGTTATCIVVRGDLAYIAHVGDTRAYLISDGNMELVTRDHSLVRRLIELGQLTEEEAEVHPQRNVLYRAIGQGESLEVDAATRKLPPSSRLLICSDGLWGVIGDNQIARILEECTDDPQEACDRLVIAANESGGPDNITVILVQMPD